MENPVFVIPQKKYGRESKVITMRVSKELLAKVDEAAKRSNRSRNEILGMALEFSMQHMELPQKQD